jgi:exopolysaccharide biosynthesis polyprenyl glycosylphosphotransferase
MLRQPKINSREKSFFFVNILYILDCLLVVLILVGITLVYIERWSEYYSYLAIGSFLLSLFIFKSIKLYRPWRGIKLFNEFLTISEAWVICISIILATLFIFKTTEHYSRVVIISWLLVTPIVIFGVHLIIRKLLRALRKKGINLRYGVIVGAGELGLGLVKHINKIPWAGIKIVGFFDDEKTKEDLIKEKQELLGTIDQLECFLQKNIIDYIYIALPLRAEQKITLILSKCRTLGAEIFMVPDLFAFALFNASFQSLGDMLVVTFNPEYRWKRYFDIICSSLCLLFTSPLLFFIALLIKLDDGGPIFYGHKRVTMAGKEFKCWKFRTMVTDSDRKLAEVLARDPVAKVEWEKNFKLKNDPRVTRIGKFLRKTSLDEMPQFFNVLKGEMSIVGARPIIEKELNEYYKENGGLYCSLKPGITGVWQVGKRSDTKEYDERIRLDIWYLKNLSFWLDLKIILKTVFVMFTKRGAY